VVSLDQVFATFPRLFLIPWVCGLAIRLPIQLFHACPPSGSEYIHTKRSNLGFALILPNPNLIAIMVNLSEVKGTSRENRTAAHTHIKGLGLRSDGTAETAGNGFVGQTAAREVQHSRNEEVF